MRRRYCIEGCGRETGAFAGTGRKNPYWCPECDEVRIKRVTRQLEELVNRKLWSMSDYDKPASAGEGE